MKTREPGRSRASWVSSSTKTHAKKTSRGGRCIAGRSRVVDDDARGAFVSLVCFAGLFKACDAWYTSPFSSGYEINSALDRCEYYGDGGTFENCADGNGVHISDWDVSNVRYMDGVFFDGCWNMHCITTRSFNADISNWDVSSVTNMEYMFYNAQNFNGDISNWDVSSVTSMEYMFHYAQNFNGDLTNWNTANVNYAYRMFYGATAWLNNHAWVHD